MYIRRILDVNLGPVKHAEIHAGFDNNMNPKPIVMVGKNGSGKSTVISNIVDAFYEIAGDQYSNVTHRNNYDGHTFYKTISSYQIYNGKAFLLSCIEFDNDIKYVYKAGRLTKPEFERLSGIQTIINDWDDQGGKKHVLDNDKQKTDEAFLKSIICYMGPERYEKPAWVGKPYYNELDYHFSVLPRYIGELQNSISMVNVGKTNLCWLLDIIADSRTDIDEDEDKCNGKIIPVHTNIDDALAMTKARKNVEKVLSAILGFDVYFGLYLRIARGQRFYIKRVCDNSIVSPTLDSLSTGQLALFNIFATIIRYADNNDMSNSVNLDEITGIVVIDEIDLHLHTELQKKVLPRLIKMFPKIQFVITTHSPLFLLGMRDAFGEDGFDVFQMPEGLRIDVERFDEFNKAYDYFADTELHQAQIREAINKVLSDKPLIITEGATDWKHLSAAYNDLSKRKEYSHIFTGLDFDFLEYESTNSTEKIDMGNSALVAMCESFSKMHQKRKMIFIADRDHEKTNNKMGVAGKHYKSWGNNVYSFLLPVPISRKDTPEICIEHLYSDDEIKTEHEENGIMRRLYMGNEFDTNGYSKTLKRWCEKRSICGPDKIAIIEGSEGEKVINLESDEEVNYALPKMVFAKCVLKKEKGFEHFDFSNFLPVFEIIKEIVSED